MEFKKLNTEEEFKDSLFSKNICVINIIGEENKQTLVEVIINTDTSGAHDLWYNKEKDEFYIYGRLWGNYLKKYNIPYKIIHENNFMKVTINGNLVDWRIKKPKK